MINTTLQALIIDDDKLNIKLLGNLLSKYCPEVNVVGTASLVENAIELIVRHKPNLLFLDIELHNQTGFEILDAIDTSSIQIVLVTAYLKYAPQSYKYAICDYLLKPIKITDLINAVNKCKKNITQKQPLFENLETQTKFIPIPNNEQVELVDINQILRLESKNNYTMIFNINGDHQISSKNIKYYEQRLPATLFFRVHNSHIVNLKCIRKYLRTKNGSLILSDETIIPISASKKKELTDRILI